MATDSHRRRHKGGRDAQCVTTPSPSTFAAVPGSSPTPAFSGHSIGGFVGGLLFVKQFVQNGPGSAHM